MTTLAITIQDEHQKFIEEAMRSGRYDSESEVVAEALAEFKARREVREARFSELRAQVQVGIDQLNQGDGVEWSAESVKAQGRGLLAGRPSGA